MLKPLSCGSDWGIVVFALLLTKKPRGYVSRFQGQWSALKVLWPGLVHAVYGLKKWLLPAWKCSTYLYLTSFLLYNFTSAWLFEIVFVFVGTFPGRYHQIFDTESAVHFGHSCHCQYSLKLWIGINLYFWSHDIEVWNDTGLDQVNWKVLCLNLAWVFCLESACFPCVCVFVSFVQFSLTV